jgi:anti-sigma regulatory factor (Ser/Thr protein kinase)
MASDETARLAALRRYRILDTEPEAAFDDLTLLASQICETPIALITLIDSDRQWFKSRVGISITETSRAASICAHAIGQHEIFVVPDLLSDERFRNNPLVVSGPRLRFYAGAPLVTPEGHGLGTICVIDRVPRTLTADQRRALEALRRQAEGQLELRRNLEELGAALAERDRAESEREKVMGELRTSLNDVRRLSAMVPFCSTCQFNMVIPADPLAIPTVTDGVRHLLHDKGWTDDEAFGVEIAIQEALANAIRHGCGDDRTKKVQCTVSFVVSGEVVVVVRDPGEGFDIASVGDPLHGANLLRPGGRGIFLINELMSDVQFEDGGRQIRMRKRVNGKSFEP